MKTRFLIIIVGIIIASSIIFVITFEFPSLEYYNLEITGLKNTYLVDEPYSFSYTISGYGYSCGSNRVAWGYGAILDSGNIAELRVQEHFGKYEFTYYCGPVSDGFPSVNIKNPTIDDIDNNLC